MTFTLEEMETIAEAVVRRLDITAIARQTAIELDRIQQRRENQRYLGGGKSVEERKKLAREQMKEDDRDKAAEAKRK